jgi:hypothetical protein
MESRRSFLKKGLVGGALLAVSGVGLSLWPTRRVTPRRGLLFLDERELSIVAAMAEVIVPGGDPVDVAHRVDAFLSPMSSGSVHDLKKLLRLVENGFAGAILDGRPQPFSRASMEARRRTMESMQDSRIALRRGGYQALRRLLVAARWTDPSLWPSIDYPGPPQLTVPT